MAPKKSKGRGSGKRRGGNKNPEVETKRIRRLEKNRISARECRKRKKERVGFLEEKVQQLEKENLELRLQLRIGSRRMDEEEEKWKITTRLKDMVEKGQASESEFKDAVAAFQKRYADFGMERRSAILYYIDQLEKTLMPTQVTKMGLWVFHQDDDFYRDAVDEEKGKDESENGEKKEGDGAAAASSSSKGMSKAKDSIWQILCRELDVTSEQKERIKAHRNSISTLCKELKKSLDLLHDLRLKIDVKSVSLDGEMQELQSVLTARQTASFITWVFNNPACMQMLNSLWNATTEQGAMV